MHTGQPTPKESHLISVGASFVIAMSERSTNTDRSAHTNDRWKVSSITVEPHAAERTRPFDVFRHRLFVVGRLITSIVGVSLLGSMTYLQVVESSTQLWREHSR